MSREERNIRKNMVIAASLIAVATIAACIILCSAAKYCSYEEVESMSAEEIVIVESIASATTPTPTPEPSPEPEHTPEVEPIIEETEIPDTISVTGEDRDKIATMLAQTIYGESRGIESATEQACIVWTVLNRVDDGRWGNTIEKVLTKPHQFCYRSHFPIVDDNGRDLKALAEDVIIRWEREHNGETDVGRVLAPEYLFYHGDGEHNWFRIKFRGSHGYWDYSLESPYEN
jgi:hypothetical protein